jgi:hypothetical protein
MRSGPPNSPRLRVHLIGRVAAELDGLTVSLKGRAARALALLALHRHVTKAQLATMLYQPENAEDENRQLTRALSELRNILGRDLLPLGTIYLATEPATDLDDLKTANTADELAALLRHGSTILPGLTDDWAEDVRREARRDFESLGRRLLSKLAPDSADRQRVAAQLRIVVPTFLATSEGMSSSAHAAALPHEIIIGVHRALDAVEPRDELTEEQTQELKTDLLHALGLMQRASKADQRYERSTLDLAQHAVDRLTAVAVPTDDLRLALARLYEGYDDFALARGQLAPLLARGDADSELLQCAGMIEMASGELAAADALFGRALERADDPQQALELRILLTVWLARYRGEPSQLVANAVAITKLPSFAEAPEELRLGLQWQRALGHLAAGETEPGRCMLEDSHRRSKDTANSHRFRGLSEAAFQAGELREAANHRDTFREVVYQSPTHGLLGHTHHIEAKRLRALSQREPEPRRMLGLAIEEGKLAVDSWATVGSLSGVANGLIDQAHAYRRLSDPVSALAHYGAVTALLRRSAGSQQLLQHRVAEAHQRELKDALSEREVANAMAQSTRLGEALTGRLSRALTLVIA